MDIEKLVEDGAREMFAIDRPRVFGTVLPWEDAVMVQEDYRERARAVLAIALAAAAEEAEAWSHNSTGTRDPEQAMQEAAQDTLAEKIAERFRTLATQLGAANG